MGKFPPKDEPKHNIYALKTCITHAGEMDDNPMGYPMKDEPNRNIYALNTCIPTIGSTAEIAMV